MALESRTSKTFRSSNHSIEINADIAIIGGGLGGCAAAIAAADAGCRVIITEEYDWIGGQCTSQAVPPDEHRWIEKFGCTRRYRQFRERIRNYYCEHYPLSDEARSNLTLNPGGGGVSRICHEPRVSLAVITAMMAFHQSQGNIMLRTREIPVACETEHDRVITVTVQNRDTGEKTVIHAQYFIDATEVGELLPLAKVEYVIGAESQSDTNEMHATTISDPMNMQAFTWCFVMGYDASRHYESDAPRNYTRWRDYIPKLTPTWPGKLLSWTYSHPRTLSTNSSVLFSHEPHPDNTFVFWMYRKIIDVGIYQKTCNVHESTVVNWPQNDYFEHPIIDVPGDIRDLALAESKELSLSLFHWLATEAPRTDGGTGYPGLYLCPEITGTADGLAMAPYIRESRRIHARFTVTENHIGKQARSGKPAAIFSDSIGIGAYNIDLHPSTSGNNYIDIPASPFQIPLGAIIPVRIRNLLPACKNIGTTHITNGCYREHPVEWNIGEAAGLLAAFCIERKYEPHAVHGDSVLCAEYQQLLVQHGIELAWPDEVLNTK